MVYELANLLRRLNEKKKKKMKRKVGMRENGEQ